MKSIPLRTTENCPNKCGFLPFLILIFVISASGCGLFRNQEQAGGHKPFTAERGPTGAGPDLHASIPKPSIPQDLKQLAASSGGPRAADGHSYSYSVDCQSPGDPQLAEIFQKAGRLPLMQDQPATMTTLEQRLAASLDDGQSILRSQGYYEGHVAGRLDMEGSDKVKATIIFTPGPRYKTGPSRVVLAGPLTPTGEAPALPQSLADAGLPQGEWAQADGILAAVDRIETSFRNSGYPQALVTGTRFTLDKNAKTLEAEITVAPQRFARMGQIIPQDGSPVSQGYLEAMRTWQPGQPWNQELLENYLGNLRQTGLFQSVEGQAAADDAPDGQRPVIIKLAGAPERTVGGMLSYDTDFGPGLSAYWEHRNLTGHGDRLRLDMPLWADMQQFTATYRYPYFLSPKQDIVAHGGFLHQNTDAYELTSGAFTAGVERRLSKRWKLSVAASFEGGSLKDPGQEKKGFVMYGLPSTLTYDSTNSLLDATRGVRVMLSAAPYTGNFHESFNLIRTRVEGQFFLPAGPDRHVLALRGVWGSLWGVDNSQQVPSSLRFYSGGGGSVRGYEYQSVGPRNAALKPLGGVSQVELGVESRWRLTETLGLVAFMDGGMVYQDSGGKFFSDMLWGAGLGLRYFSAIGPLRMDVAVPLERREGDSAWQLYLSLGQNF